MNISKTINGKITNKLGHSLLFIKTDYLHAGYKSYSKCLTWGILLKEFNLHLQKIPQGFKKITENSELFGRRARSQHLPSTGLEEQILSATTGEYL